MKDRRTHKCGGRCGRANCGYETTIKNDLKKHIHHVPQTRKENPCPHCCKCLKRVDMHIKRKHPAKYVRKIHPCPYPGDPHGWSFVKKIVRTSESNDKCLMHRWTKQDREELIARNNTIRHEIAIKMYKRWKSMGDYDDAGGYIKGGLHLRMFRCTN